jgi:hypothetical protein
MEMNEAKEIEDLTEDSETAQKPKAPKKVFVPHPTVPALKTTIVGIAGKNFESLALSNILVARTILALLQADFSLLWQVRLPVWSPSGTWRAIP